MDSKLRTLLRDTRSTPEECYHALKRAGFKNAEIEEKLVDAEKLSGDLGAYEQLLVDLEVISLQEARRRVANFAYQHFNFDMGHPVAQDPWMLHSNGALWMRAVYFQPDDWGYPEVIYAVSFVGNTALFEDQTVTEPPLPFEGGVGE